MAAPLSFTFNVGVFARTPPTNDPDGQVFGFAAKVASGHAFCSVVRRDGSCVGRLTSTDLTFASPVGMLSVVSSAAPLSLEVCALLAAENAGLNASDEQNSTWSGFESPACTAPNVELSVVSVALAEQLVGLIRNPCLRISMFTSLRRMGTPLTIVGSTLSAVTRPGVGSM